MNDKAFILLYVIGVLIFVIGITLELTAWYHCGFSGWIYGRNIFWAYWLGYCGG
jgi:hypothetical protein